MAEVLLETDTYDVHIDPPQTLDVEVDATAEQLLPLIDVNQKLAAANKELVSEVLPTLRGGLQTKEVTLTDIEQTITPDDGYLGLQKVVVPAKEREVKVVNRRMNEIDNLYYAEEVAEKFYRSDYAVAVAFETNKVDETTSLLNADAYLTSDGDYYDSTNTHTWHDDDDEHYNRFIVCYFKVGENKSDFDISYFMANRIAIKGDLGALIISKNIGLEEIIVFDDSSVLDIRMAQNTNTLLRNVKINNILNHTSGYIIGSNSTMYRNVELGIREIGTSVPFQQPNYIFSLILPNLTKCKSYIFQYGHVGCMKELYIPQLEDATFSMAISKYLTKVDAPKLRHIGENDNARGGFVGSPKLKKFSAPLLETVSSGHSSNSVISESALEELYLPKLTTVSDNENFHGYIIGSSPNLKRLILPEFVNGFFTSAFTSCPALEYVYMPKSLLIQNQGYNGNRVSNMPNLHTWIHGKICYSHYGSSILYDAFLNCPRLIHLEITMTQDSEMRLPKWSPTEALNDNTDLIEDAERCATNREQFFVNFVELLLHHLQDRSKMSKLTMYLSAEVYAAIFNDESGFEYDGTPIGDYVTNYVSTINWAVAQS